MKRAKKVSPISPNFIVDSVSQSDVDTYITPTENEPITVITDSSQMEDIVILLGKFSSKSQARKAGWAGPIPEGFNVWQIGKDQFVTLKNITLNENETSE